MIKIDLKKTAFGKQTYKNVIDTNFNQLVKNESSEVSENNDTVDNFFRLYNLLFYDIPKDGILSHKHLIKESTEYVGISENFEDIQVLLDEISQLRTEILEKDKTILTLSSQIKQ